MSHHPQQSKREIVVFDAAGQWFGVPSEQVVTIVRAPTLAMAPQCHPAIKGIMNLHGQIVAVFDVRYLLQLPGSPLAPSDHIIVTRSSDHWLALRADRAVELVTVTPERLAAASEVLPDWHAVTGVAKWAEHLVLLVDPQKLWSGWMANQ
jgi:purine-binding chemotaxis protein CheW